MIQGLIIKLDMVFQNIALKAKQDDCSKVKKKGAAIDPEKGFGKQVLIVIIHEYQLE
jgi:hypothetical protein